jgi:hypothetical protein
MALVTVGFPLSLRTTRHRHPRLKYTFKKMPFNHASKLPCLSSNHSTVGVVANVGTTSGVFTSSAFGMLHSLRALRPDS